MPNAPDDPRLTAFALGELDELDRPEVEALLEADPEARAAVEEIRAIARLLGDSLRDEPGLRLAPEHHQAIESKLKLEPRAGRRQLGRWLGLAVAASVLGLAATLLLRPNRPAPIELAMTRTFEDESARFAPQGQATNAMSRTWPAPTDPGAKPAATVAPESGLALGFSADGAIPAASANSLQDMPSGRTSGIGGGAGATSDVYREGINRPADGPSPAPALAEAPTSLATKPDSPTVVLRATEPDPNSSRSRYGAMLGRGATPGQAAGSPPPAYGPQVAGPSVRGFNGAPSEARPAYDSVVDGTSAKKEKLAELGVRAEMPSRVPAPADLQGQPGEVELFSKALVAGDQANRPRTLPELADRRKEALEQEVLARGDAFAAISDNPFLPVAENPLSTFSIDVDTSSYANVRRVLNQNALPNPDAVRIEELVNYFPYAYPAPRPGEPFSITCEVARSPWNADHRLVRIGLKGREIQADRRPPSNLVFLIDVSGSMQDLDKLPLLKAGMKLLVDQLGENDRVAIVVYASQEGLALDSTRADRKAEVLSSLEQLQAGGSTDGGKGIQLAYDVAVRNFIKGGTNRVILATDGDFNVGVTEGPDLDRLIEAKRETGVFLSVLGFGQGNVKHDKLESLADKGNGQYSFIDTIKEARKVLVEQMGGTLVAIAKDVKIQVEFDPKLTSAYRLIGYENRLLQARDFEDDKKDAGEVGSGHCVTAFYEVVPAGQGATLAQADAKDQNPKIQASRLAQRAARGNAQLLKLNLRYKAPDGDVSKLITTPADDDGLDFSAATADYRFASSVAGFGMLLRNSPHKGTLTWDGLIELASGSVGPDPGGYRAEFLGLVRKAREIAGR